MFKLMQKYERIEWKKIWHMYLIMCCNADPKPDVEYIF